jgi:hypothetical protein
MKIENVGNSTAPVVPEKTATRKQYQYLQRIENPLYSASRVEIPYRVKLPLSSISVGSTPSVLSYKHNNVTANSGGEIPYVDMTKPMFMTREPRNITKLLKTTYDQNTGEMTASEIIETNDTFARLKRRKRALKSFTDHFNPIYKRREITLLFITFTLANENGVTLRAVIDQFKKRCRRNGYPCHGYFWVMEISEDLHVHYHGLFAIDRINLRGKSIPDWMKLDGLWGARTTVEMVKKNVHGYLSKYMDKGHEKIEGRRMYGRSMPSMKNNGKTS